MEEPKTISKKILAILGIIIAVIAMILAVQTDADEYIEATSTPKIRMPYYYEN